MNLACPFSGCLFSLLVATSAGAWAQTTAPADTLRPAAKQQLNSLPPAARPGTPTYSPPTRDQVVETPPALTLGASLGWGAPYAAGIEMAYRFRPAIDGNVGIGLGTSGAKLGAGVRLYLPSRTRNQLFVGTNLVYSLADIEIDTDDNGIKGRYLMRSSTLLHLRGGLHHQYRRNALQVAVGYGAVLAPHPVIELLPGYGPGTSISQRAFEIIGPGGVEVSLGFLFGLGRSKIAVR